MKGTGHAVSECARLDAASSRSLRRRGRQPGLSPSPASIGGGSRGAIDSEPCLQMVGEGRPGSGSGGVGEGCGFGSGLVSGGGGPGEGAGL